MIIAVFVVCGVLIAGAVVLAVESIHSNRKEEKIERLFTEQFDKFDKTKCNRHGRSDNSQ